MLSARKLTRGVGKLVLLALDPVLEAFCVTSCSGNFILHLFVRHLRRHIQGSTLGSRRRLTLGGLNPVGRVDEDARERPSGEAAQARL